MMMMMEWKWYLWFIRMAVMLLVLERCSWCTTDACLEHERIALLHLKPFFNYRNQLQSWVEVKGSDCCKWERVECNTTTRRLIQLSLNSTKWEDNMEYVMDNRNLNAWYLNASMFLPFEELKRLYLSGNVIGGSLENEGFGKLSSTLSNLEILNLSENYLNDSILLSLSELSSLRYLDLSINKFEGSSHLRGLNNLTNLKYLDLSWNNIESISNQGFQLLSRLNNLETLDLSRNSFKNSILFHMRNLSSLKTLRLSGNQLKGRLDHIQGTQWRLTNLEELDLSGNLFRNNTISFPQGLSSLKSLTLYNNHLQGSLDTIGLSNLTNLKKLDLSGNQIESFQTFKDGGRKLELTHLEELYLDGNHFNTSVFASLNKLSNLKSLSISENQLKGSIDMKDLEAFIKLRELDMSYNELRDFVIHQENNTKLEDLILKGNSFTGPLTLPSAPNSKVSLIDISQNKLQGQIPTNVCSHFPHLSHLFLSKNAFEGDIPPCLSGMKDLSILDLSDNQLSGRVPEELITKNSLTILRLSNNNLSGHVLPVILNANGLSKLYLDGNNFSGEMANVDVSISEFPTSLREINLGNNKFYGNLPRWMGNVSFLERLALSQNGFEGSIPMEFCNLNRLEFLDLSENNLFGSIPSCFNTLNIKHVHLHGSRLSGPLPIAFYNISSLVTLDLRGNNLTGSIPKWIGTLSSLSVLLLKDNHFHGEVPVQLCKLDSLNIIDLSQNMFSGIIPSCLGNLTLSTETNKILTDSKISPRLTGDGLVKTLGALGNYYYPEGYLEEVIEFTTKSGFLSYEGNILTYMTGIDLSCNNLTGHIPPELGNLSEIYSLNLSHNKLTGVIPSSFAKLHQIESLDLSYNNLSGEIPNQLVELNSLEVFNVAYNNLSGSIPEPKAQFGTFIENSYEGNLFLCGAILHKSCSKTDSPSTISTLSEYKGEDGLIVVLLTIFVVLYINQYWRRVWFSLIGKCITTCRYSNVGNFLTYHIFKQ
ncbi:hypothetical protein GOBAR_DD28921 [Gossypium barbadense]|nr:hypothetical protein GOBAR_DD28921 [Gossypium barbadense]